MKKLAIISLISTLFLSCKSETKKESYLLEDKATEINIIENPSAGNSSLPRLFANDGKLFFSWVEASDSLSHLNYAVFEQGVWSPTTEIISGSDWFVNWADFPAIAENNGNILSSFLQKSAAGTYTYDIKLNLYSASLAGNQGDTPSWKRNFILHTDGTQSEHGFVSMLPYGNDSFFITWLDGRNTIGGHDDSDGHGSGGAMTLRGAIVHSDGTISDDTELDARICDCCQTSAAMTNLGPVIIYRDRSEDEIRDISIVRWIDGKWTTPAAIGIDNWKIAGCPVNGPSIDAIDSSVVAAWFTAAKEEGDVQLAFSLDSGATFGAPIEVDTGDAIGRVDVKLIFEETAAVLWIEPQGEESVIQLMKVEKDGSKSQPITISKIVAERSSGFPQLEKIGDILYIAWTDVFEKQATIKTAIISISDL